MTARRMTTTLGALALGIATIGIGPAMAQTGGAPPSGMPAGAGMPGASQMPGGQMTAPGPMTGRPAAPMGHNAGPGPGMPPADMGPAAGMTEHGKAGAMMGGQQVGRENRDEPMPSRSYAGAPARNSTVDQLNQQSLEAARKGEAFTPPTAR